MTDCLQVFCTTDDRDEAEAIAEALVRDALAACVQIAGPITSVYHWEGEVARAEEWLLLAKTTAERFPELEIAIVGMHSYDVPEIVAVPIASGSAEYLQWLTAAVGGA
ncbi:MAG: divalent-cation tolerance protein CutA [candidate division WS1 bacterium]|jgi:periplasmic divalent cation tolerance protein|nr:divalent-cation tolerance protein CutA [candidate division WS1 bacterium]